MIANEAYRKLEELRRYLLIVKTAMHDDLYIEFDRKVEALTTEEEKWLPQPQRN